jgi:hypothetical protein
VYRFYDACSVLLYVGSAYNPDERCRAHESAAWWPQAVRRADEWHPTRGHAYRAEMAAIAAEDPKCNAMGTRSYRTPDTEGTRARKALAGTRQRLIKESQEIEAAARAECAAQGGSPGEVDRAGKEAAIEFLDATGLFVAAVKERRKRLAASG